MLYPRYSRPLIPTAPTVIFLWETFTITLRVVSILFPFGVVRDVEFDFISFIVFFVNFIIMLQVKYNRTLLALAMANPPPRSMITPHDTFFSTCVHVRMGV